MINVIDLLLFCFSFRSMETMIAFLSLVVGVHCVMAAKLPLPPGIKYLGISYDLLKGNPDGEPHRGNIDPGLLTTRRIYGVSTCICSS